MISIATITISTLSITIVAGYAESGALTACYGITVLYSYIYSITLPSLLYLPHMLLYVLYHYFPLYIPLSSVDIAAIPGY